MSRIRRPWAIWPEDEEFKQFSIVWWVSPADAEYPMNPVSYIRLRYRPCNCRRVFIGGAR